MKRTEKFAKNLKIKLVKNKLKIEKLLQAPNIKPILQNFSNTQIKVVLDLLHLIFSKQVATPIKFKREQSDYSESLIILSKKFSSEQNYKKTCQLSNSKIITLLHRHQNLVKKFISFLYK